MASRPPTRGDILASAAPLISQSLTGRHCPGERRGPEHSSPGGSR